MPEQERPDGQQTPVVVLPPEYYMPVGYQEDEIDLHQYVNVLFRYWWLVIGTPLVALLVSGVLAFFVMKPSYQATALVAVIKPRYIAQFSPNFQTVPLDQLQLPYKAYPTLAMSADLLQRVYTQVTDKLPPGVKGVEELRGMVSAKNGQDPSLIELTVSGPDPRAAADIANIWADEFAKTVQEVYGQGTSEVPAFEAQLKDADAKRQAAEQAVVEFEATNPAGILEAQLADKRAAFLSAMANERTIQGVISDAASLRSRLAKQSGSSKSDLVDDLSALLLEVNALNSSVSLPAQMPVEGGQTGQTSSSTAPQQPSSPVQLQIQSGAALSDKTVAEQIAYLDNLIVALNERAKETSAQAAAMQPELLALQQQLEQAKTQENRLMEERSLSQELYHSLALKLEEARLNEQTNGREVQVAARALPPLTPSSPRKMMMLAVAGALGLMVGVFGAFVVNFLRTGPRPSRSK